MNSPGSLREDVPLIGSLEEKIAGDSLPSALQVLQVLLHKTQHSKLIVKEAIDDVFREVQRFWVKANIQIQPDHRCCNKIYNLYDEYRAIRKNLNRPSNKLKEDNFRKKITLPLDISHQSFRDEMNDQERETLLSQIRVHIVDQMSEPESHEKPGNNVNHEMSKIDKP